MNKAYTDIEQSKKLAEILPKESADACWTNHRFSNILSSWRIESTSPTEYKNLLDYYHVQGYLIEPAWSLAALQDIIQINYKLEKTFLDQSDYCTYSLYDSDEPTFRTFEYDNPVDACVEMILKLHEQKLL